MLLGGGREGRYSTCCREGVWRGDTRHAVGRG